MEKKVKDKIFPKMRYLYWYDVIKVNWELVESFMASSMPPWFSSFHFNIGSSIAIEPDDYMKSLTKYAYLFRDNITIHSLKLSSDDLSQLMLSVSHCSVVCFCDWIIESSETCDFTDIEKSNIKTLNLTRTGALDRSDWKTYPFRLEGIIKAISKCSPLRHSIENINILYWNISEETARKMLTQYGVEHMKILNN